MTSTRAQAPLRHLLALVGWPEDLFQRLVIEERPKVLATPWPIGPMAAAVLGAVGIAASRIHEMRTGEKRQVTVDTRAAELSMASSNYLLLNGKPAKQMEPFTGFYQTAGGQWVYLHGNFQHLREGLIKMIGVGEDPSDVRTALLSWEAEEVEAEAIRRGLCAARVRSRAEWLEDPHCNAISRLPPIRFEKLGSAQKRELASGGNGPLAGLRMLDLSRVIAGPMAGRAMAEHGATVMLVSSPNLPSIVPLVIDTGFGKRSTFVDLDTVHGRDLLRSLALDADGFLDAYRPGALERRGFGPHDLARMKPGLISVSISAFGGPGPWQGRRGYDTLVQATTGMAYREDQPPRLLPCQPLDYLTGDLCAFAAMVAAIRRHEEGGSWHASLSLAATAQWMWSMRDEIGDEPYPAANPGSDEVSDLLWRHDTAFGEVAALAPALRFDGEATRWRRPPVPLGSDPPTWPRG